MEFMLRLKLENNTNSIYSYCEESSTRGVEFWATKQSRRGDEIATPRQVGARNDTEVITQRYNI